MSQQYRVKQIILISFFVLVSINQAYAAPPVDAGTIQRDIEKLKAPNLPPVAKPADKEPTSPNVDAALSVKVTAFQFIGATLLPDTQLQAEVASYIGQTLDYNALNTVTKKISQLYQKNGWLAKVFLPPQDIQNGIVTIEINEAKLGDVRTNNNAKARLNPAVATQLLAGVQQKGAPLNSKALERAMLLINDTPGFAAIATLSSGAQTGQTDISIQLIDKPLFNANIWADNYGSRLLGKARLNGQVSLNNISGWGDQLNLQALLSRGLEYVHADIDLPVSNYGTRLNLGGAVTNYRVVQGASAVLKPQGDSYAIKLALKHPIMRSRFKNVNLYSSLESFNSRDSLLGLQISNKAYRTFMIGLKADSSDAFGAQLGLGGGTFWGGANITAGNLSLDNASELAADILTKRSDGSYNKLNFYLGRQQILSEKWIAKALLSGQFANTNLGGFEKFSLGGPAGLSGFTVGEANADQGWMLNLEGRYAITTQWSANFLADAGGVCQYKNTWAGWNAANPNQENCYQLASMGVGLGYTNQYIDGRLIYGRRITGNRGADSLGNDSEGENSKQQLWLQVGTRF